MITNKGLTAVKGFRFGGICADGKNNKKNIGLLYATMRETHGAGVYTKSDVLAAPVIISQKNDAATSVKRAILINSGVANAFTGKKGFLDAENCAIKVSRLLNVKPEEVYMGSTGIIGRELNISSILKGIEGVHGVVDDTENGALSFIEATMTTDTVVKQASLSFDMDGKKISIASCVKGAGMIMPDMATMLCVIITDAHITPDAMKKALKEAADHTFNCITIDGDTSTNDSIFLLANGLAGNELISSEGKSYQAFVHHLGMLMEHMAKELVNDGEGITKFITIKVINTPTREKARTVAYSIGNSPLVKTTLYGQQLNWGRLMMAIGKAQTRMDCNVIDLFINGFKIVSQGEPALNTEEYKEASKSLTNRNVDIVVDFKQGQEQTTIWTCDYSLDYIKINSSYLT